MTEISSVDALKQSLAAMPEALRSIDPAYRTLAEYQAALLRRDPAGHRFEQRRLITDHCMHSPEKECGLIEDHLNSLANDNPFHRIKQFSVNKITHHEFMPSGTNSLRYMAQFNLEPYPDGRAAPFRGFKVFRSTAGGATKLETVIADIKEQIDHFLLVNNYKEPCGIAFHYDHMFRTRAPRDELFTMPPHRLTVVVHWEQRETPVPLEVERSFEIISCRQSTGGIPGGTKLAVDTMNNFFAERPDADVKGFGADFKYAPHPGDMDAGPKPCYLFGVCLERDSRRVGRATPYSLDVSNTNGALSYDSVGLEWLAKGPNESLQRHRGMDLVSLSYGFEQGTLPESNQASGVRSVVTMLYKQSHHGHAADMGEFRPILLIGQGGGRGWSAEDRLKADPSYNNLEDMALDGRVAMLQQEYPDQYINLLRMQHDWWWGVQPLGVWGVRYTGVAHFKKRTA